MSKEHNKQSLESETPPICSPRSNLCGKAERVKFLQQVFFSEKDKFKVFSSHKGNWGGARCR